LRLLFRLEDPIREDRNDPASAVIAEDQEGLDRRAQIMGLPADQQPAAYLAAFRQFGALDEIDLQPANLEEDALALFPGDGDASLVLADIIGISLAPAPNGPVMTGGAVDNTVRSIHVATSTIQELLNGPLFAMGNGEPSAPPGSPEPFYSSTETVEEGDVGTAGPDAGGPRVDPESVALAGDTITLIIVGQALKSSVSTAGFSISSFDTGSGWKPAEISSADYDIPQKLMTVKLATPPGGKLLRVIVRGTGEFPILGKVGDRYIPLAGPVGGPAGDEHNGRDFVYMLPL